MRFVKWFSVVVLALATIAFLATFAIESYAAGKSGIYQLVEPRTTEDLFGDGGVGTEIGSPQALVILDEKAVLPSPPGDTKRYLNKTYLDRNGIYPLQLQTVKFFTSTTRLASGIAMVLSAVGLWFAHRKLAKPA